MSKTIASGKRYRYFYGWNIVATGILSQFAHIAEINSIIGLFLKPMGQDVGFSRAAISGVQSMNRVTEGLLGPAVGRLLDRGWVKQLMIGGALLAGGGLILLSQVRALWQLYLLKGLIVGVGMAGFGRLVVNVTVNNWFVRKRGRALGIVGMGGSLGTILVVPLMAWVLTMIGWRWSWAVLGLFVWAIVLLPAALFMVRRPEDMGLQPDGMAAGEEKGQAQPSSLPHKDNPVTHKQAPSSVDGVSWTGRQALLTRTFWLLTLTIGMAHLATQALNLHLIPYLQDLGFAATIGATVVSVRGVFQLIGGPIWGFVAERIEPRYLASGMFLVFAVSIFVLMNASSLTTILAANILYGGAFSGTGILAEIMWANYYGRRSLGVIRGLGEPVTVIFSAAGPIVAGVIFDLTKSYDGAFLMIIGGAIISSVLVLFCTRPKQLTPRQQ
ncbi:MAG: MFS transporter [Chloroflexi bacterium]|nr:MFS transporter [Chloroflexota bacterium]